MYDDFKNYVVDAAASRPKRRAELIKNISKGRAPLVYSGADIASQAIEGIKDTAKAILDPETYTKPSSGTNERNMELPRFTQDRDAIFQENVQALLGDDREQYSEGRVVYKKKGFDIDFDLTPKQISQIKNTAKGFEVDFQLTPEQISVSRETSKRMEDAFFKKLGNILNVHKTPKAEGGDIDVQMVSLMPQEETHTMPDGTEMPGATHEEYETTMSTDEDMEDGYLDFILDEALEDEEETYLMEQLESNDKLSLIFDKVIDVATEFAGSGPVEGPGSGVSDSIPARLSDGEFVFTAKATEELGADNLEAIMREAETQADGRQELNLGGKPIKEEEMAVDQYGKPIDSNIVDDEIRKGMLSTNPRLK